MMESEDKIESTAQEIEVNHEEMRSMLWGRQCQNKGSVEKTSPSDEKEASFLSKKERASRPTSLSEEWEELSRIKKQESRENLPDIRMHTKKSIWRNFLSLCTGLMFAFTSFLPLRNIQTSLYYKNDVGYYSLATVYSSFMIGCIISPWIVQNAKPKGLLLLAMSSHVFYVAANLLPSFLTLLPASFLFGFLQAPLWSVQEVLIGSYGTSYSSITGIRIEKSIRQFQGVFVVFCHTAQILGNLIESGILSLDPGNLLFAGDNITRNRSHSIQNCTVSSSCPKTKFGYATLTVAHTNVIHTHTDYLQILLFVYLALACLSVSLLGLCLKKPDIIVNKRKASLKEKVAELWGFMRTKTFIMTVLLMVFTGMQQALVIGDVTKLYGTETLGLGMVGYAMMCYGTAQLAMLLILEKIQRMFHPFAFISTGFFTTLGLSYILITWDPHHGAFYTVLGFMAAWGAVDAIWQSQVQGILVSSAVKKEPAVVCFRVCQGLGLTLVFLSSIWLSLLYKVCLVGATLILGVIGYMILEVTNNPVTPSEPRPFNV